MGIRDLKGKSPKINKKFYGKYKRFLGEKIDNQ